MFIKWFSTVTILLSLCTVSADIIPKLGFQQQLQRGYGAYSPMKGFVGGKNIRPQFSNYYQNSGFGGKGIVGGFGGKGINPGIQNIGKGIGGIGKGIGGFGGGIGIQSGIRPPIGIGKPIGGPIGMQGGIRPPIAIGKPIGGGIIQGGIGKGPMIAPGFGKPIIGGGFNSPMQGMPRPILGKGPMIQPGFQQPILQGGFPRPMPYMQPGFQRPILQNGFGGGPIIQSGRPFGKF